MKTATRLDEADIALATLGDTYCKRTWPDDCHGILRLTSEDTRLRPPYPDEFIPADTDSYDLWICDTCSRFAVIPRP